MVYSNGDKYLRNFIFFFNPPSSTDIYSLSLHDALPISSTRRGRPNQTSSSRNRPATGPVSICSDPSSRDRKSTRLNSSHRCISYAVFCLKKKIYILISDFSNCFFYFFVYI